MHDGNGSANLLAHPVNQLACKSCILNRNALPETIALAVIQDVSWKLHRLAVDHEAAAVLARSVKAA